MCASSGRVVRGACRNWRVRAGNGACAQQAQGVAGRATRRACSSHATRSCCACRCTRFRCSVSAWAAWSWCLSARFSPASTSLALVACERSDSLVRLASTRFSISTDADASSFWSAPFSRTSRSRSCIRYLRERNEIARFVGGRREGASMRCRWQRQRRRRRRQRRRCRWRRADCGGDGGGDRSRGGRTHPSSLNSCSSV